MPDTQGGGATVPHYRRSSRAGWFSAVFPSDCCLEVQSTRTRRYPGLASTAPDTRALYATVKQLCPKARRVVDVGCGSGLGTAELIEGFEVVTALDVDASAVQFVHEYAPKVSARVQLPGSDTEEAGQHDLACVIDVLGHCEAPVEVLRRARRLIADDGRLFVAEPRAYPSQALVAPVRRAYSRAGLEELLVRAGFEVDEWIDSVGHFVACLARPSGDDTWTLLEHADRARTAGQGPLASSTYARVAESAAGALKLEGLIGCAVAQAEQGQIDDACRCLLEAAELAPGNARPLSGLAEVSLLAGDAMQALSLAVRALEDDPCNANAVAALARAADSLSQNDAFATWRIASCLAPSDPLAASELSRMAAERGDLPHAIWVLERLREFNHELSSDFHVTLAWLCLAAERLGDARVEVEMAQAIDPESPAVLEVRAHLAQQS